MLKGQSYTTGTVHYAKLDSHGQLVQVCGIKANQMCYLAPTEADLTCKKCNAETAAKAPKVSRESKTYGRQEWTITDLREVAKELGIKGRTTKDGETLLAEIIVLAPQFA